jgi:hypothetical protein
MFNYNKRLKTIIQNLQQKTYQKKFGGNNPTGGGTWWSFKISRTAWSLITGPTDAGGVICKEKHYRHYKVMALHI